MVQDEYFPKQQFLSLCVGDRYIVADCGGGTVDLTVHQIEQPKGTLKELYKASGMICLLYSLSILNTKYNKDLWYVILS